MALGASSLGFHRISPSYPNNILLSHYVNQYIIFEGYSEVNSKDKFYSSVLLGFHGIIVTLQRLCLQLRCIISRVTLGTFLLLGLRDNDKYLMGMLLPCHRPFHKNAMETQFEESIQHYKSWLDDHMQIIKKKDFLSKRNFTLINILQRSSYLFDVFQCDTIWTLWEIYVCNIFRLYEAGQTAKDAEKWD